VGTRVVGEREMFTGWRWVVSFFVFFWGWFYLVFCHEIWRWLIWCFAWFHRVIGLVGLTITAQFKRVHQLAQESPRAEEPDVLHDDFVLVRPGALVRADLVTEGSCAMN
jgi:hypothetical protein